MASPTGWWPTIGACAWRRSRRSRLPRRRSAICRTGLHDFMQNGVDSGLSSGPSGRPPLWTELRHYAHSRPSARARLARAKEEGNEMSMTPEAAAAQELEQRVMSKVIRRLVPFIFLCYVISYLDRVNIGFASTFLKKDLGLSNAQYGLCSAVFFVGYCLLEVPSNLILEKV